MLSTLVWVPIAGAILIILAGAAIDSQRLRRLSLGIAIATFGWSLFLITKFDISLSTTQLSESLAWLDPIGLTYRLGVDGLSFPLVLMNGLLLIVATYISNDVQRPRLYFPLLLLLGGGVNGAFLSQNLLLFFLFFEIELIPLYLLIAIWGGEKRGYAATKFLIYTAISGVLILAAFFGMAFLGSGDTAFTFNYQDLNLEGVSTTTKGILLVLLLLGFGIKIPIVPLHTWLPDAHVEASTPVSTLLAGVLLKLGTYGLLRFGLGLLPEAWQAIAPFLAVWAVVSVIYGCLTAITQTDMKKMVAYSSVGHMGYILLALAAATPLSLVGATFQMVSHGLISALLFILVGIVYKKTGTRDIKSLNGLLNPERGLPITGSLMILAAMASAGTPGMIGFIAEFVIFRSSFAVFPIQTLLCMIGTGLTAVYFLIMIDRVFFGRLAVEKAASQPPISNFPFAKWQEKFPAIALALIIVFFGLVPNFATKMIESSADAIASNHTKPSHIALVE
ncbi:MAG: NADH-quinone oxidoreductase subunit M [Pseudanabaena sp. M135S2SP2A07QC]|nr:NADH-quinone oxidoreductase subunit M [Pseudanabaena sp. M090S1SP2A07QC]MCA6505999.1 NADH-quinone oxidoreductase subunit M [Pseudanabaena sp. M172S2SP2A07QC]MCA6522413.1 NADH-quinone oxidoreductase subunit M [Pseudanabaena sp. M051S1SP2A07QC]MCA6525495.1 NADH-quinone oxidoreductase subunit M [Pseudanabaena sp. M179S2SP2A07QC]MCA6529945.1 NADH-quinone oxidoreductase subunit M [Pseudanabaena sp. M125S2SP2A07QC]MCA6532883.1 NADH-quinone oxidoreductase subunit M [Pseudanabaena sp. M176S2SP2A07Q